jgi:hypothetical protein
MPIVPTGRFRWHLANNQVSTLQHAFSVQKPSHKRLCSTAGAQSGLTHGKLMPMDSNANQRAIRITRTGQLSDSWVFGTKLMQKWPT